MEEARPGPGTHYPGLVVGQALQDDLEDDDHSSRAFVGPLLRERATTNGAASLARAGPNRDKPAAGEDGSEGPRLYQQRAGDVDTDSMMRV